LAFSIKFLDEPLQYFGDNPGTPFAIGEITLGSFRDNFAASLHTWTKGHYEAQWQVAIDHLLKGNSKAALITEYINPEVSSRLRWWPMYRVGHTAYFQEGLLFFENAPTSLINFSEPFCLDQQFTYVPEHQTVSDEGDSISEWSVSLAEVEAFASTLK
jgi:hypothetical protein